MKRSNFFPRKNYPHLDMIPGVDALLAEITASVRLVEAHCNEQALKGEEPEWWIYEQSLKDYAEKAQQIMFDNGYVRVSVIQPYMLFEGHNHVLVDYYTDTINLADRYNLRAKYDAHNTKTNPERLERVQTRENKIR